MSARLKKWIVFIASVSLHLLLYLILFFLVIRVGAATYSFAYDVFGPVIVSAEGEPVAIEIAQGESTREIAEKLYAQGIVTSDLSFYVRCQLDVSEDKPIQSGTYTLSPSMTYEEILDILTGTGEEE